jgi:hypothetical protein
VDIRVASGSDDVEESSSGAMSIDSGDLELIYYQGIQVVGVRFTGVNIPKGAVITNAYIQFKVDEVSSKSIKLAISGEASPNAAAFSTSARNVSKRLKTSNKVTWSPVSWTKAGEMGKSQRTSNIKSIVQEIVNQSGWGAGNSLVIIITGSNSGARIAKSFDGDKSGAPILHIEFSIPTLVTVASPTSTLTMTTTATLVPATVPATFTPIPTEVITIPTIVVTATEIVAPTDTPVPTLVPPYPTETPVPIVP